MNAIKFKGKPAEVTERLNGYNSGEFVERVIASQTKREGSVQRLAWRREATGLSHEAMFLPVKEHFERVRNGL